jgi:hypothetical protein
MLSSDLYPEKKEYWIMEQIQSILHVTGQLKQKGVDYLLEQDKEKGLEWANEKLKEQLEHFLKRLKETVPEKEFSKYLKENNLKQHV